jgi:hypothetical protein
MCPCLDAGQERDTGLLARRLEAVGSTRGESQPRKTAEAMIATNFMASLLWHTADCADGG